jgi:alkanesulfonate monooxygenase
MLAELDPADVAKAQETLATSESEGQRRVRELHGGLTTYTDARQLEVHPALWSGIGLMRSGAGTALVGSHTEVAVLIAEYAAAGRSS